MAKISTYPIISTPTFNDLLIGTDVGDLNITKNFLLGDVASIISNDFVPYEGATRNVNLGNFAIEASSIIVEGGLPTDFLKADGSLDSTVYTPQTRTLTINSITFDLSANRSWDLNTINSLTTTGTGGPATYIGKILNIPQYQAQGNYITQLSGEATAVGPGNATVTLSNLAVISKVLTGLNITGGTIVDTDSILTAFGKVQNQLNGLTGGVTYQGTWNAATNVPFLQSSVGTKGYYYVVSVAGSTNLNGITDWKLGDWAIFNGSTWEKVDNTDAVVSVNGYTGAVVLNFSDVGAPPATRNITINGVQFDLTADRTWTVGDVRTDQSYANPSWITSLAWTKITGTPTTLAGYGITDGVSSSRTLTINGVTFDLTANRTWNVGTVTSVGTSGPLTGGTITGSGTIGITQAGASSDGYLSSTDWNTFNNKQNALTNPVTGTGTIFTLPMWGGATSLIDSPLSYGSNNFNFQYNSATGGSVTFTNSGLTAYAYTIQMNNFGSPRSTVHSYTDGVVVQSIGGSQVSRIFANGNTIFGIGIVDNGNKLELDGSLRVNTIANATTDTDRFLVSDSGVIKYVTGAQLLIDIGGGVGTVTSVGLSMPPAFTVSNSPVTSSGTLTVVGAGNATQYVRGDGALATLPSGGGGGGASVNYYLNGSVNQGTIGGVTYYEMNRTPIIGTGTDFNRNTNGYIASFLTDAGDPALLSIPAGNWNFETYFNASSGGGSPTFYIELYKYDGTTFTLIASNSGSPKLINDGTRIEAYYSALAVPQTTLTLTDRLAIRIYVTTSFRTITLHTENGHLCEVITTFTTGLSALNGLTAQVQYFATGTSGTDFNILSAVDTHTFNLPTASAVNRGALSSSDWTTFNGKQNAINLTTTGTVGPATLIGSTLNIPNYTTDLSGYVTLATDQTITGLKTIMRGGDVLNFKIGTDTLYGLKVAYNQNELAPAGEATWSFVNTFNNGSGTGLTTTPISFFRGVLVTGERLVSVSVNDNLLSYYNSNPSGRYPIYAYNTGVQQFASSIIVGETNGVVNPATGAIADLPAGVVANFKGRVIGSNAVNNNEFATLGQVTSGSRSAISLTTTGTSGPATYSSVTGVLNIPEYQGGVTSFNTRTGAVTLTSLDVTTALGFNPVTDARTLSINGVTYDLTANRSWTVGVNPSSREIETFIATSLQTVFTVTGGYTVGLVDVFINGVRLTSSDFTATNGTTVVLTTPTMVNNIVDIIKYTSGIVNSISGSGTTNELAYFTASTTIASLTTATYPSLTELSYVKGVTSSIQTQLDGKQAAGTYVTSVTGTSPIVSSGGTTPAISIPVATTSVNGYLSSTDWTTFNNKQNTLTNPVTGTGTTNYLPKFTGTSTIGNSLVFDNGTQVGVGLTPNASYGTFQIKAPAGVYTLDLVGRTAGLNGESQITFWNAAQSSALAYLTNTASNLYIGTGANQPFTLSSGGNFIFGTTTDNGAKLQVNGATTTMATITSSATASGLQLTNSGGTASSWVIQSDGGAVAGQAALRFYSLTASSYRMSIDGSGNVGIGTLSPESLSNNTTLQIDGTNHSFVRTGSSNYGGYFATIPTAEVLCIANVRNPVTGTYNNTGKAASGINLFSQSSNGYIEFLTTATNNSSPSVRLTIASTGAATFSSSISAGGSVSMSGTDVTSIYTDARVQSAVTGTMVGYGVRMVGLSPSSGSYTIANMYAIKTSAPVVQPNVTVTNSYGIYIGRTDDPSSGGIVTNRFALVTEALAGNILLGTTTSSTLGGFTDTRVLIKQTADGTTGGGLQIEQNSTDNVAYFGFTGSAFKIGTSYRSAGSYQPILIEATPGSNQIVLTASTGRVLMGSTTDQGNWKAQVTGNMFVRGSDATSSNAGLYMDNSNGILLFRVRNDGAIYTGNASVSPYNNTIASVANLVITATDGNLARSTASSQRFKENIIDWTGGLDVIMSLKPRTFTYKETYYKYPERVMLGLIAEEVAEVCSYLADYENENGTGQVENVRYANIVVPLIKAIQELKAELDELKSKN